MAAEWRPDLALPLQEQVVQQSERLLGTHPRTAAAMYEELYGKNHHWTAEAVYLVGHERAVLGKFGPAREDLGRTRASIALEKIPTALCLVQTVGVTYGDALLANGKPEESLAQCDRARAAQQADTKGAPNDKLYGWDALRCRGEALLALGRVAEALEPLQKSVALTKRIYPGDLARARFALARAMVSDRAAGVALAKQAREELALLPHPRYKALVALIDRWLTA